MKQRRATYRVYRSLTVVGREKPSDLRLRSEFISSTHCVLYWQNGKLWFVDLLSSNGTEKRGRRCDAERSASRENHQAGRRPIGFRPHDERAWVDTASEQTYHEETEHDTASKNIFDLHAPQLAAAQLADSRESFSASESSVERHRRAGRGLGRQSPPWKPAY